MKKIFLFLFISFFIIYFISSPGETPFNYFTRLAYAFTQGEYYITESPSWLSELIPSSPGYYIPYPPGPAFALIPFVILFGKSFQQQILAQLMGALASSVFFLIGYKLTNQKKIALWISFLVGLSSIVWFMSSVGSSWYLAQISAFFFLTVALYESLTKKRPFLIGLAIGFSYLARVHTILAIPFFLIAMWPETKKIKTMLYFFIPILFCLLINSYYNFIRFGVIWDKGYLLIPNVLNEPWFTKGIIHPSYILNNLKTAFVSFPIIQKEFPYLIPSWYGLSIWITTPSFIFILLAPIKNNLVKASFFVSLILFIFVAMHGSNGFAQFGYRFAVDFYAFLFFLTIHGVNRTGLKWYHYLLLFIGVVVNLWGVIFINKFEWVRF